VDRTFSTAIQSGQQSASQNKNPVLASCDRVRGGALEATVCVELRLVFVCL
jgi:hypothetical protein